MSSKLGSDLKNTLASFEFHNSLHQLGFQVLGGKLSFTFSKI